MTTIQIKNKSNTFIFTKERLEKKAKEVSKPIYVYDKRTRALCAYLGKGEGQQTKQTRLKHKSRATTDFLNVRSVDSLIIRLQQTDMPVYYM